MVPRSTSRPPIQTVTIVLRPIRNRMSGKNSALTKFRLSERAL